MPLVTIEEVQTYLSEFKITLGADDDLPEEAYASSLVTSKLATKFDTSGWTDSTNTPELVKQCIAMLIAAQRYNKLYSESEDGGNPYAMRLESMVYGDPEEMDGGIIASILSGSIVLDGVTDGPAVEGTISFYPDDDVGLDNEEEAARFTMGKVF